jgi:hypothetical protein
MAGRLLIVVQFAPARMVEHPPLGARKLALLAEHKLWNNDFDSGHRSLRWRLMR